MILPTTQSVIDLTSTSLPESVVSSLIEDAALIAEDCIASYSESRQTSIVRWLAAHLVASTAAGGSSTLTSDKLGDAAQTFARATVGEGFSGTIYGQQALALDTNGCLNRKGKARASVQII